MVRRLNYYVDDFDSPVYKTCCEMGEENTTRSFVDRVYNMELKECKLAIWKCCKRKFGAKGKKVSD